MTDGAGPAKPFDARRHLTRVNGHDYMEIKWRLAWLRYEHPDAVIETERLGVDDQFAMFRAVVRIPGGGSATAHGTETAVDFGDYVEKAETKAVGRALAHLGYGAEFSGDDAADPAPPAQPPAPRPAGQASSEAITPQQEAAIRSLAQKRGLSPEQLSGMMDGKRVGELTQEGARALIGRLQAKGASR